MIGMANENISICRLIFVYMIKDAITGIIIASTKTIMIIDEMIFLVFLLNMLPPSCAFAPLHTYKICIVKLNC